MSNLGTTLTKGTVQRIFESTDVSVTLQLSGTIVLCNQWRQCLTNK